MISLEKQNTVEKSNFDFTTIEGSERIEKEKRPNYHPFQRCNPEADGNQRGRGVAQSGRFQNKNIFPGNAADDGSRCHIGSHYELDNDYHRIKFFYPAVYRQDKDDDDCDIFGGYSRKLRYCGGVVHHLDGNYNMFYLYII